MEINETQTVNHQGLVGGLGPKNTTDYPTLFDGVYPVDKDHVMNYLENAYIVKFKLLDKKARLPAYRTKGAAGFDISCILDEPITIKSEEMKAVRTGLAVELPEGTELQIRPRSGLAFKHGISIINSPCTIDSDFRGEIVLMLINHSGVDFVVNNGDRIAQGLIKEAIQYNIVEAKELNSTTRGTSGFGSTGVN